MTADGQRRHQVRPTREPTTLPADAGTGHRPARTSLTDRLSILHALEASPLPGRRRFATWATQEPVLAGLHPSELRNVLLDDTDPIDYDRRDQLLGALVRLSHSDEQATLLLIVCLLPGLRRKIAVHGWGLDRDEAAAIALAALCRRIWTYPLVRRPRKIAMNLLLDTAHDLIDARRKELAWQATAHLTDHELDRAMPEPAESPDLLWDAARNAGVLTDRELALLRSTSVHDLPITQVAPLLGISHDAARKARQRAVHKLKAWLSHDQHVA
jgi:DNA-directed RNA polymerase specialized sigma24 family protein